MGKSLEISSGTFLHKLGKAKIQRARTAKANKKIANLKKLVETRLINFLIISSKLLIMVIRPV